MSCLEVWAFSWSLNEKQRVLVDHEHDQGLKGQRWMDGVMWMLAFSFERMLKLNPMRANIIWGLLTNTWMMQESILVIGDIVMVKFDDAMRDIEESLRSWNKEELPSKWLKILEQG